MKMKSLVLVGVVAALAVAGISVISCGFAVTQYADDDEAPIYVKNGSLDIHSGDPAASDPKAHWKWTEDTARTEFRHEPATGTSKAKKDDFYVKVVTTTKACKAGALYQGKKVDIDYGYYDNNGTAQVDVTADFHREGSPTSTRLKKAKDYAADANGWTLKHTAAPEMHIVKLAVDNDEKCAFRTREAALQIVVCAGPNRPECK